jgi:hypothetical protein
LRRGLPILGICRGMQVLNVALGGTLYQDLPSQMDHSVLLGHRQETPKWEPTHEVEVDAGAQVAGIMDTEALKVNSYHHQAVKDLAHGLVAVAHAPDGVVEAVVGGPLAAVAGRGAVARRGDARLRRRALQPLRGPCLRRGATRASQVRGLRAGRRRKPRGASS